MANEKKTKEELTKIIFRELRKKFSMNGSSGSDVELLDLLPEYEKEVKNILAEIVLQHTDDYIVFRAMILLLAFFAHIRATRNILYLILERIIAQPNNQDTRDLNENAKRWVAEIANNPTCKYTEEDENE